MDRIDGKPPAPETATRFNTDRDEWFRNHHEPAQIRERDFPPKPYSVGDVINLASVQNFTPGHAFTLAAAMRSPHPWISVTACICMARRASGKPINRREFAILLEFEWRVSDWREPE